MLFFYDDCANGRHHFISNFASFSWRFLLPVLLNIAIITARIDMDIGFIWFMIRGGKRNGLRRIF